jgi:hypothetical protein
VDWIRTGNIGGNPVSLNTLRNFDSRDVWDLRLDASTRGSAVIVPMSSRIADNPLGLNPK